MVIFVHLLNCENLLRIFYVFCRKFGDFHKWFHEDMHAQNQYKGMKMEIIQSEDHGGPHLPTYLNVQIKG